MRRRSWIFRGVSVNPMAKPARQRETLHSRAIYRFHPMFATADFTHYYRDDEPIKLTSTCYDRGGPSGHDSRAG